MSPQFYLPNQPTHVAAIAAQHNEQALYSYGEYTIFFLMWRPDDFDAGLVKKCRRCQTQSPVFKSWEQPTTSKCPDCFGTTFEGGFKARLVRPAIWKPVVQRNEEARRGEVHLQQSAVYTDRTFRLRNGDYLVKADNTRWRMRMNAHFMEHSGFGPVDNVRNLIGYRYDEINLEEPASSPATLLPPTDLADVQTLLEVGSPHLPLNESTNEIVRGPLT